MTGSISKPAEICLISVFLVLLNSCFTASVFTLPERETAAANKRQDYLAAAALPVAVVADVATAPVQLAAIGVYSAAKAGIRPEAETDTRPEDHEPSGEAKRKR